ncbi:hypothetical protein [Glutamicibacter sp. BW80]|uniref:hypothetical protein n=2 Tax=unclassified Glutamicibacter TaxID=2627139 RepID=UPI001144D6E3|nr:hypothetical protein [Glutamicibacter sp. BW80]
MSINPTPQIWIAGEYVPTSASGDPTHIALDGLEIEWGSHERFTDIVPAILKLRILDTTGEWIAEKVLPGTDIKIAYLWSTGNGSTNRYMFRGMITSSDITPRNWRKEASEDHGYFVDIVATDRIGQLGNTFLSFASDTTSTSTLAYRANKINEAAGNTFAAIVTPEQPVNGMLKEVYTNSAALTVLDELYRGLNRRPEYDPHTNRIESQQWGGITYWRFAGFFLDSVSGKYKLGLPRHPQVEYLGVGLDPLYTLPAEHVESEGALTRSLDSSITQVSVKYHSESLPDADLYERQAVQIPNYRGIGNRVWNAETKALSRPYGLAFALKREAEDNLWRWRLEDVSWNTKRTGGFDTEASMHMWLQPRSNEQRVFLQGSAHNHLADYIPIYGLFGSTITYRNDSWNFALKLAPYGYELIRCDPLTFDRWGTGTTDNPTFGELHETTRLSDMKFTDSTIMETI